MNIMNQNPFISHQTSSQTPFSLWILQDAAEIGTFCFLIMCNKSHKSEVKIRNISVGCWSLNYES